MAQHTIVTPYSGARGERYAKVAAERRERVAEAGRNNDIALLDTLGSMERYAWHEARKTVDASHVNPYKMSDRRRAL